VYDSFAYDVVVKNFAPRNVDGADLAQTEHRTPKNVGKVIEKVSKTVPGE
jgi:hypothetical protein